MKFESPKSIAAALLILPLALSAIPAKGAVILDEDFDSGTLNGTDWSFDRDGSSSLMGFSFVTNTVRSGSRAARLTLNVPNKTFPILRNELQLRNPSPSIGLLNREYTYTFSHFIPSDWPTNALPIEIAQFHVEGDSNETGRGPVLSFLAVNGQYKINVAWSSLRYVTQSNTNKASYSTRLVKGQWTDWRVNVRWSWGDPSKPAGFLRIWKNGTLVVDRRGPNCFNDVNARYFKWGLYTRSMWAGGRSFSPDKYTIYLDEMKVSEGSNLRVAATALIAEAEAVDSAQPSDGRLELAISNEPDSTADIVQAHITAPGMRFDQMPAGDVTGIRAQVLSPLAVSGSAQANQNTSINFDQALPPGGTTTLSGVNLNALAGGEAPSPEEITVHLVYSNGRTLTGKMAKLAGENWVFSKAE